MTVVTVGKSKEEDLFKELNSVHPKIKFIREMENDGRIFMLDVAIKRQGAKMIISVFRKPTTTNPMLKFESSHPSHVKIGLVKCFFTGAKTLCDQDLLHQEMTYLQNFFY